MAASYYQELLRYFTRSLRDSEAAADIVQEAYARLFSLLGRGQTVAEPRALLYRTAHNLSIDRHRHLRVQGEASQATEDVLDNVPAQRGSEPEARAASMELLQVVLATIDRLPLRCREAFMLYRFDGLSHAEIAQRMGISRKGVEQHVHHAMLAVRQCREQLEEGKCVISSGLRDRTSTRD